MESKLIDTANLLTRPQSQLTDKRGHFSGAKPALGTQMTSGGSFLTGRPQRSRRGPSGSGTGPRGGSERSVAVGGVPAAQQSGVTRSHRTEVVTLSGLASTGAHRFRENLDALLIVDGWSDRAP
ncbi:hypothetical protein GCM10009678_73860 [Actinomadura kijaniata]